MSESLSDIRTYRLDTLVFEGVLRRRMLRRLAWVLPLAAVVGLVMARRQASSDADVPLLAIPIIVGAIAFGSVRALRMAKKNERAAWETYQLTLGPNVLRRSVVNLPAVEILRTEVTRIDAGVDGLSVATADRQRFVFVPRELVDFEEVRSRLAAWRALESPRVARSLAVTLAWAALLFGSLFTTTTTPDLTVALVSGVVLVGVVGFTIREFLRSTVMDNRQKAATVGAFALFLGAPLFRLFLHFAFGEGTYPP